MKPQGVGLGMLPVEDLRRFGLKIGLLGSTDVIGGLLPDWAIRQFITIDDFVDYDECPAGVVSYGLSSAGYDIRVGGNFKVFTNANCVTVSPRNIDPQSFLDVDLTGHNWVPDADGNRMLDVCWECTKHRLDVGRSRCPSPKKGTPSRLLIPPNSFALGETVEYLHIPRNVNALCLGKSTYARTGIIMNFTPFEPGWHGIVTVEISNSTPLPVEVYPWEGIGQAQFQLMIGSPERSYGDRKNAKYQGQTGLTLPCVK